MDASTSIRSGLRTHWKLRGIHSLTRHTDLLTDRFGAPTAAVMRRVVLEEYRVLLPHVPSIGRRRDARSQAMALSPWALALYRVVGPHGGSVQDAVTHDLSTPRSPPRRAISDEPAQRRLARVAATNSKRRGPRSSARSRPCPERERTPCWP